MTARIMRVDRRSLYPLWEREEMMWLPEDYVYLCSRCGWKVSLDDKSCPHCDAEFERKKKKMIPKRCDTCLYEYSCTWDKAGDELKCEDWKPEGEQEESND